MVNSSYDKNFCSQRVRSFLLYALLNESILFFEMIISQTFFRFIKSALFLAKQYSESQSNILIQKIEIHLPHEAILLEIKTGKNSLENHLQTQMRASSLGFASAKAGHRRIRGTCSPVTTKSKTKKSKFFPSPFLVNRVAPISVSLAFGPHSSSTTVNAATGGWPSCSTVCFTPMLFPEVLNARQGNSMHHFSSLWYDSTGYRTLTDRVQSQHSTTGRGTPSLIKNLGHCQQQQHHY